MALFASYQPGAEITLDFAKAGAASSLHVELLNDEGVHNKLFRQLPTADSAQRLRFELLPNPRAGGHNKHIDRAALTVEGPWVDPYVSCIGSDLRWQSVGNQ